VFGTPATSVQMKALNPTMIYDHCAPAWREIHLLENGEVETQVHYLA
jgi:hypothetical protein